MANPHTLHYQLTERCNLACPGCYLPVRQGFGADAATVAARVFAPLADAGVTFCTLTGGEPLLHPECVAIAHAAASHFKETQVVCNGLLLSVEMFKELRAAGVTALRVSMDSVLPEIHDQLRGKEGTYARVVANLRAILALPASEREGVALGLIMTVQPANVAELDAMVRFARGLGVEHLLFQPLHPYCSLYPTGNAPNPLPSRVVDWQGMEAVDETFLTTLVHQVDYLRKEKEADPRFIDNALEMLAKFPDFFTRPGGPEQVCGADRFLFVNSELKARGCLFCEPLRSLAEDDPETVYVSEEWAGFQKFRQRCTRCLMGCQFLSDAQRLMESGFESFHARDFARAKEAFARSLSLEPSAEAEHGLGLILKELGELEAARPHLDRAVALDPANGLALADRSEVLRRLNEPEEALANAREAARLKPENAHVQHMLGLCLRQSNFLDEAVRALARSVALAGDEPWARFDLGLALLESGRPEDAEPHLRASARLAPGFPFFRYRLAQALLEQGQSEKTHEARELLETLIAAHPDEPRFRDLLTALSAREATA